MSFPFSRRVPRRLLDCFVLTLCAAFFATSTTQAEVVVESVRAAPGTETMLAPGDVLVSWRPAGSEVPRPLRSWGEVEVMPLTELLHRPIVFTLDSGEDALVAQGSQVTARPDGPDKIVRKVEAALGAAVERASDEVARAVDGAPFDLRSWAFTRLGQALTGARDLEGAAAAYQRAIEDADPAWVGHLHRLRGIVLQRLGRPDAARGAFEAGVAAWHRVDPEGIGESILRTALGHLEADESNLERAAAEYETSCSIRTRIAPRSQLLANCLTNIATIAGRQNDLALAEETLLRALDITEEVGGDPGRTLSNLGIVARLRGDFARAATYLRKALDVRAAQGDERGQALVLGNLGNVLAGEKKYDQAIDAYDRALEIQERLGADDLTIALLHLSRGQTLGLAGRLDAAEPQLRTARRILDSDPPSRPEEASIEMELGALAARRSRHEEAVVHLRTAADALDRLRPDSTFAAAAHSNLAINLDALGHSGEAERHFARSLDLLERQQRRVGGGDRGLVAFRSNQAQAYKSYLRALVSWGRADEAFAVYERSRAQALLVLFRQRDLRLDAEVPDDVRAALESTGAELERAYLELAKLPANASADARDELRASIESLHAARSNVARSLDSAAPKVAATQWPTAASLMQIRAALSPGTLLLAFDVATDDTVLFALTGDGAVEAATLNVTRDQLEDLVAGWTHDIDHRALGKSRFESLNRQLGATLLGPVADRIEAAERILLVPDGPLHQLAFAALPDPAHADRYLIEGRPIARQVSASVHAFLESSRSADQPDERADAERKVVIFGDPASPETATARFRRDFGRLPASRVEAETIARLYGPRARIFLADDATEEEARRQLTGQGAGVGHFACHAIVDEQLPLDSALLLSPSDCSDRRHGGGLLQAWEIAEQMEISTGLVILSACETAGGGQRAGEGIVGLVRAFQVAGARDVIASLRRVDDEATAALMTSLHRELAAGAEPAAALRAAQLELLAGPVRVRRGDEEVEIRATDPRFWAPFVLVGSPDS